MGEAVKEKMTFSSQINTGLPETPRGVTDPKEYEQLLLIYNAIRALQTAIDAKPSPSPGSQGLFVPYYIPPNETFFVPKNKQALFSTNIVVDGDIVIEGYLIEVD